MQQRARQTTPEKTYETYQNTQGNEQMNYMANARNMNPFERYAYTQIAVTAFTTTMYANNVENAGVSETIESLHNNTSVRHPLIINTGSQVNAQ